MEDARNKKGTCKLTTKVDCATCKLTNEQMKVAWPCSALDNMVLRYMTSNGTELQYITLR